MFFFVFKMKCSIYVLHSKSAMTYYFTLNVPVCDPGRFGNEIPLLYLIHFYNDFSGIDSLGPRGFAKELSESYGCYSPLLLPINIAHVLRCTSAALCCLETVNRHASVLSAGGCRVNDGVTVFRVV